LAENELNIELRSPEEVARRCIVLAALLRRLSIDVLASATPTDDLAGEAFDLNAWLQLEGIREHATATEARLLDRPVGELEEDEIASVAWQAESLATLAWSLRLVNSLPHADAIDVAGLIDHVPSPWDQTKEWILGATLRSESEIARERDRAEIFEWRVALEGPRRRASGPLQLEYAESIADVARESVAAGLTEGISERDFTIAGVPIASIDDEEIERRSALAAERLRALNWLCGFGDSWDRVPLDV
jgi:hypothetical protein